MSNRTSGTGPGRRISIGQILIVVAVLLFLWFRSEQMPAEEPLAPAPATVQLPAESMSESLDDTFDSGTSETDSGFEAGQLDAIVEPDAEATALSDSQTGDETGDETDGWEAGSVSTEGEGDTQGVTAADSGDSSESDGWSSGDVTVAEGVSGLPTILYADLPDEAKDTIRLIDQGGPYPFRQDGGTFQNREGILPDRNRGYYQEFTVISPWEDDRGARRIVGGADGELYYTDDHYDSFREVLR